MMERILFPRLASAEDVNVRTGDMSTHDIDDLVAEIVDSVRTGGEDALRRWASRLDGLGDGDRVFLDPDSLREALEQLSGQERELLAATADRIHAFAAAQRDCVTDLDMAVPGGRAGHRVAPVECAGCYVPGGRYPLPSSVLMTVIPARVAGVESVWVATPKPHPAILAAAALAGADGVLVAGGAQAIAALAFGCGPVPAADVVVGPGNRYVTAAKRMIAGTVRIDMLAGPSELAVIADDAADPAVVAADLLAQAEHDDRAVPVLIAFSERFADEVRSELERQLATLPTRQTALAALSNGGWLLAEDDRDAAAISDCLAPEHLQICTKDPSSIASQVRHFGALFLGATSAEVFGDYGAGPNHVLPTGTSARSTAGLSVVTFLRLQTWLALDADTTGFQPLSTESSGLARMEGLEAHARAVEARSR
jgi:phosphoribosyl-ATP pyrophosphohydrolase/phosphoribosyl-AMP cyclohydrolase/histidinol dehydrogenase